MVGLNYRRTFSRAKLRGAPALISHTYGAIIIPKTREGIIGAKTLEEERVEEW